MWTTVATISFHLNFAEFKEKYVDLLRIDQLQTYNGQKFLT